MDIDFYLLFYPALNSPRIEIALSSQRRSSKSETVNDGHPAHAFTEKQRESKAVEWKT